MLAEQAGTDARGLVNTRSAAYRKLKLDRDSMSPEEAAEAISTNPTLMIRPILAGSGRATLGFDQEAMQELL